MDNKGFSLRPLSRNFMVLASFDGDEGIGAAAIPVQQWAASRFPGGGPLVRGYGSAIWGGGTFGNCFFSLVIFPFLSKWIKVEGNSDLQQWGFLQPHLLRRRTCSHPEVAGAVLNLAQSRTSKLEGILLLKRHAWPVRALTWTESPS